MAHYEDIEIDQGASVKYRIQLLDVDGSNRNLTNYTARGKLNRSYDALSSESLDFLVNISSPVTQGIIDFSLTSVQSNTLTRRRYVYDIEIEHVENGITIVERVLEGKALVSRQTS